jgi:hypothetical protein
MDDRTSTGHTIGSAVRVVCLLLFIGFMAVLTGVVGVGGDPDPERPRVSSRL